MITFFKSFSETTKPFYRPISVAIDRIRNGSSKAIIEKLRSTQGEERDSIKKSLCCVLFSGEFSRRAADGLVKHSGFIVLDFDHVGIEYKEFLKSISYIYATWVSPSGAGVKALVKISHPDKHYNHFLALQKEFPEIDASGKDVSRICYESYDPDIYVNENAEIFTDLIETKQVELRLDGETDEEKNYLNLKKWIEKKGDLFIDGQRNVFIMKMAAAMNRVGISESSCIQYLLYDYVRNDNSFTLKELTSVVHKVYKNYSSAHGTMRFEKEEVKKGEKEVKPEDFMDVEIEIEDVIYFSDVVGNLRDIRLNGGKMGETTHYEEIDKRFRWMRGEVTVLGGWANIGKTALMNNLQVIRAVKDDIKWAVFSPENFPTEYYYRNLVQCYIGKPLPEFTDEEFEMGYEFINNHFYNIYPKNDSPTPELVLKRFAEAITKHKVDGVLIDPFNQLSHNWSSRDDHYLEKVLAQFSRFAQNFGVYFTMCVHPAKPAKTRAGEYEKPTFYDLAGGAMWANKCENIIWYHRPNYFKDPRDARCIFESQKIKKQDMNGLPGEVEMVYDRKTYRFYVNGRHPLEHKSKEYNVNQFIEPAPF